MENNNKVNAINVKNVTKIYKTANAETRALKNANLTIFDNEFFSESTIFSALKFSIL